jgi:outer membrane autotransporter protein
MFKKIKIASRKMRHTLPPPPKKKCVTLIFLLFSAFFIVSQNVFGYDLTIVDGATEYFSDSFDRSIEVKNSGNVQFGNVIIENKSDAVLLPSPAFACGGAMNVNNQSQVSFNGDTKFSNNEAPLLGGAIHNYTSGKLNFNSNTNVEFSNNFATMAGGAISNAAEVSFKNNSHISFSNNISTSSRKEPILNDYPFGSGGAIANFYGNYILLQAQGNITFDKQNVIVFQNNTAGYYGVLTNYDGSGSGGAIANSGSVKFNNDEIVFQRNNATHYGGAISNIGSNAQSTFSNSTVTFGNNIADVGGGGIYNGYGGIVEIVSSVMSFMNNSAVSGNGGAIYVGDGGSEVRISGEGEFRDNVAGDKGGAIYISSGGVVSINAEGGDIVFEGNEMVGGAGNDIYIEDWGGLELGGSRDIVFRGGISGIGGLTNNESDNISITKSGVGGLVLDYDDIEFNRFRFEGGGIWLRDKNSNEVGKVLTINKLDASGSGGQVMYLNVRVDGNGAEGGAGDKVIITSEYSGNIGIVGKQTGIIGNTTIGDGIKVVEFGGSCDIDGSSDFSLVGGKIDNGAYDIKMYKGNDVAFDDWSLGADSDDYYLRTALSGVGIGGVGSSGQPILTDLYKTMANMPLLNVLLARAGMNSLEKRLGDLRGFGDNGEIAGLWVRGYGIKEEVGDIVGTELSLVGVEAGFDVLVNPKGESDKVYIGAMFGYIGSVDARTELGDSRGDGDGRGESIGIYGSWLGGGGWFVDIVSRYFFTEFDMTNYSVGGYRIEYKPSRGIWGSSMEVGKRIKKAIGEERYIRIEPKVEVQYLMAMGDSVSVENGVGNLEYGQAGYLSGRAGILLGYAIMRGGLVKAEPYIEAGYREEFDGKHKMRYGGVGYESDIGGGGFEGAVGVDIRLGEMVSLYIQGNYENGEKFKGYGCNIGIRVGIMGNGDNKEAEEDRVGVGVKAEKDSVKETASKEDRKEIKEREEYNLLNDGGTDDYLGSSGDLVWKKTIREKGRGTRKLSMGVELQPGLTEDDLGAKEPKVDCSVSRGMSEEDLRRSLYQVERN